ncbi:MAG: 50S ribosomal protein L22 [Candidatus Andersenbacteria bacterium RIFCSPHIGHO2_12_FULL_45_11b]|uniref:Large ribosomal subunit protein uL22 n=1 Tax=Candidatus Andersenbacteria bacterium RIFCSPHIGHO2_12_FULL_45_11b TaxID=1797282 RepID=A0A1G1X8W3_9BACT|nr:MAG: 50S ribosomal protein L22 [Candidatus Andersenbacteria bacterium RIFCSPHIGHO2_12_FULL_45_11b]
MKVSATQKHARMAPRKIRPYARMIQGMASDKAITQLTFATGKAPEILLHVVKSAVANAVNTHELAKDSLKISSILVNQGLVMKRFNPVSKGMAHSILKRTAHVTVVVEGDAQAKAENKKAAKKQPAIKTISADEFVATQKKEQEKEEQELAKEELHKHDAIEERSVETIRDKKMNAFEKTKMNQQGGDSKKTHRRKSIG